MWKARLGGFCLLVLAFWVMAMPVPRVLGDIGGLPKDVAPPTQVLEITYDAHECIATWDCKGNDGYCDYPNGPLVIWTSGDVPACDYTKNKEKSCAYNVKTHYCFGIDKNGKQCSGLYNGCK